jgi:predicted DsbA family dithiol-disulfide isomerase
MTDIKVFSDFACPFCYIGLSIADKLQKEDPEINIKYYPYELNPDMPKEGEDLKDKIPEEHLNKAYERTTGLGSEYNLVYNSTKNFNTNKLHKASLFARDEGKFYEFAIEAFKAIFENGENVSEDVVINNIGIKVGLNIVEMNRCLDSGKYEDEMEESKKLARVYEIDSVPSFIVDERKLVTNLKPYEEFKKDLLE